MVESAIVRGVPSRTAQAGIGVFEKKAAALAGHSIRQVPQVLDVVRPGLERLGWNVSTGTGRPTGIEIGRTERGPVLADAFHDGGVVLWIELGRAWTNRAFLEHAIEAGFVPLVTDVVLAVRYRWYSQATYDKCLEYLLDLEDSSVVLPYRSLSIVGF